MAYKQRGDPRVTVRLPKALIEAMQQMAKDLDTTTSAILRDGAIAQLEKAGYEYKKGGRKTV